MANKNIFKKKKGVKGASKIDGDYMGGGSRALETDIYPATIKAVYLRESGKTESVAMSVNFIFLVDQGDNKKLHEHIETIWTTNSKGEITYKDKKTKEEKNLPGYMQVNTISLLLLGKDLGDLSTEEKKLKLWDSKSKKDINQAVDTFDEFEGLDVQIALQKQIVDKNVKNAENKYVPGGETYIINELVKVFPESKRVTMSEVVQHIESLGGDLDDVLEAGDLDKAIVDVKEEGGYAETWLEKNKGQTWDKSIGKGKATGGKSSSFKDKKKSKKDKKSKKLFNDD